MMAEMAGAHQTPAVSFVGTLLHADDDRLSVRVDEVLRAPSVLGELTGVTVTVLASAAGRPAGRQYMFEVEGASYGTEIVFRAVDIASTVDRSTAPVDRRLAELARSADLIVVGEVASVDAPVAGERLTEHDPAMAMTHVLVRSSVKGTAEGVLYMEIGRASCRERV